MSFWSKLAGIVGGGATEIVRSPVGRSNGTRYVVRRPDTTTRMIPATSTPAPKSGGSATPLRSLVCTFSGPASTTVSRSRQKIPPHSKMTIPRATRASPTIRRAVIVHSGQRRSEPKRVEHQKTTDAKRRGYRRMLTTSIDATVRSSRSHSRHWSALRQIFISSWFAKPNSLT